MSHPPPMAHPPPAFPHVETAWGPNDPIPGLLAAGGTLMRPHLRIAYSQGIFPWFSEGQPTLWWSPDPRMVLQTIAIPAAPQPAQDIAALSRHAGLRDPHRQRVSRP